MALHWALVLFQVSKIHLPCTKARLKPALHKIMPVCLCLLWSNFCFMVLVVVLSWCYLLAWHCVAATFFSMQKHSEPMSHRRCLYPENVLPVTNWLPDLLVKNHLCRSSQWSAIAGWAWWESVWYLLPSVYECVQYGQKVWDFLISRVYFLFSMPQLAPGFCNN